MSWDQLVPALVGAVVLAAGGGYFAGVRRAMKAKKAAPSYDKVKTK